MNYQYFTSDSARELGEHFQEQNVKRKIGGQYIFEYMNLGFKFEELNDKSIRDIGVDTIDNKYNELIEKYKQALLDHI